MKWGLKIILPVVALLAGVVAVAIMYASAPEIVEKPPEVVVPVVAVIDVDPRRYDLIVRTHGTVAARTESELVPQVSGQVVRRSPQLVSGGFFEEGDLLLEIEQVDYEVARERARANLARAESEHARARKELERLRGLADSGVASASQFDDAERSGAVTAAAVREARAALAQADRDLERTSLRAPFTGRVRRATVDVGQFVARGISVGTLYAIDRAEVRLPIADLELAFLELPAWQNHDSGESKGPPVSLRATFGGVAHEWQARVVRTEGEIDARSRMINVVAEVDDPYGDHGDGRPPLAVGLFVEAAIAGRSVDDVVVAPRAAMRDHDHIVVVDAEDRLRLRRADVVRRERADIVLAVSTFEPGDRIVTTALEAAVDGMKVRPVPHDGNHNAAAAPAAAGR